jgi:NO-binding membrane sensor protein with MHYT domain
MIKFVAGVIVGIAICTVGFTGMTRMFDNGVIQIQEAVKEASK